MARAGGIGDAFFERCVVQHHDHGFFAVQQFCAVAVRHPVQPFAMRQLLKARVQAGRDDIDIGPGPQQQLSFARGGFTPPHYQAMAITHIIKNGQVVHRE